MSLLCLLVIFHPTPERCLEDGNAKAILMTCSFLARCDRV